MNFFVVLCPHRDKSGAYVHIHQDSHWFDIDVSLYGNLYVYIETSLRLMSIYIRIFNVLTMVLFLYTRFYVRIETSLIFMSTYISIFNGLTMVLFLYMRYYVNIETCRIRMLMSTYIRIFNGLCLHRDKSEAYVHIHQAFQRFDDEVIIV